MSENRILFTSVLCTKGRDLRRELSLPTGTVCNDRVDPAVSTDGVEAQVSERLDWRGPSFSTTTTRIRFYSPVTLSDTGPLPGSILPRLSFPCTL